MSDSGTSFPFSSKPSKTNRIDFKREMLMHEYLRSPADARNLMIEKDMLIKSQRNTIKLYEKKIENLEKNNSLLKQIIGNLSSYITDELNEELPQIPSLPDETRKLAPISNSKKPSIRTKSQSVDLTSLMNSITQSSKVNSQSITTHNYIFDPSMQQNLYQDFHEAEFLKSIVDSQLSRDEMQKVMKFLLGKTSQDLFIYKTRTIIFESLSLFLSLRNVAFLNSPDIFMPRTLEMLLDILEVEKITVYVYDSDMLCSIAVTAEIPRVINIEKTFGHFAHIEDFLIINSTYDDERYDKQYDQICGFVTRNLVCVPMMTDKVQVGILECCNKKTDFIGEDLFLLGHVARQLAMAQVGIETRDKLMGLGAAKTKIKGEVESCKDKLMASVFESFVKGLAELISCEKVNFYLFSQSSQELELVASTGSDERMKFKKDFGVFGLAYCTNSILNTDSSHKSFRIESDKKSGFITREILAVPLSQTGVLECLNKKNFSKFSKSDEKTVQVQIQTLQSIIDLVSRFSSLLLTSDINEFSLQNISQAVFHINSQNQIQKLNPAGSSFLSQPSEKLIGASFNEVFSKYPQILQSFLNCVKSKVSLHEESINTSKSDILLKFILISGIEESPSYIMIMTLI